MGLFDFLKGKNKSVQKEQGDDILERDMKRFKKEIFAFIPRYMSTPGAEVDLKARHQETNEVVPFAVGFPEQFEPWRTIRSLADRRGIIYQLLDSQIGNSLELWQVIERFNDDRYAERALAIALEYKTEEDEKEANYWNALARTNFILTRYEDAEDNCLKALAIDTDNIRTKRIYADVLHCTNRQEKAHSLYNEIIECKVAKDKEMTLPIQNLLGFDGDIVNSPIYALSWLKGHKNMNEETWEWANDEFYYSPHFRFAYGAHLIETSDQMKGFIKVLTVSQEMPWYKDAVINSYSLIDQLGLTDIKQADKVRLAQLIKDNQWM